MEKASQDLQHPQIHQQALKCPRCDSSNTKFCYYNNYSLAQPRHFCKGCKRYWTRGGTLRNVPVGGGCRKNKRVKRSNAASSPSSERPALTSALLSSTDNCTTQNAMIRVNPFLRTQSDAPLRFPNPIGSDLESQLNAFELGFSSQNMITTALGSCGYESREYGDNGKDYKFEIDPTTPFANVITSSSLMVNLPFFLGSSSCSTSTTATSLISSSFQQEDLSLKETRPTNNFQVFNVDEVYVMKDMKVNEEGIAISQNSIEPMGLFDSSVYLPSSNVGANWPDLVNYGSSVTSLI